MACKAFEKILLCIFIASVEPIHHPLFCFLLYEFKSAAPLSTKMMAHFISRDAVILNSLSVMFGQIGVVSIDTQTIDPGFVFVTAPE